MADIQRRPLLRHLRGAPTTYVRHLRGGKAVHEGVGVSFWFRPLSAVISEVPVDDRELPMLFHARTADFQDVSVQATVTYRIADPALAAGRVDFAVDPDSSGWRSAPLDQVAAMLTETAQQHALTRLARMRLREAIADGPAAVRADVAAGLGDDPRTRDTGIAIVGVRVVAVRPEAEVERALQTPAREEVQQEADRATYERRALAVERERAIAENEMQNQIELATREEALVAQRGQNDRRRAEEAAAAALIAAEAQAGRDRIATAALAAQRRELGAAKAEAEAARLAAHQGTDPAVLLALAARALAEHLPEIGQLNLSPDVLTTALARLGAGTGTGER
ncbi:SPFH domain-containing protein [Actinomadura parmotrematis]|uniref:SPFH domain-containing protein n=1 Tax=Actinomadura parmotrematis TaxID=2864039 RepID=A0ABS7G4Q6_9ACTN|nr:SPFH domain-containing protein [Actinomadura parmotrematis]MBW8487663.1 SPFH domain-containing protein [Actinomadura parmotrematis]